MPTSEDRTDRPPQAAASAAGIFSDDAVVKPVKGRRTPETGRFAVLVATAVDLDQLVRALGLAAPAPHRLFTSRVYVHRTDGAEPVTLVGPMVGAPYAVMLLETLLAWGVRHFFFLGWCGAVSPALKTGDLLVPTAALIDEGTSVHYRDPGRLPPVSYPSPRAVDRIRQLLNGENGRLHAGAVWTTDAIFRETPAKIRHFQAEGALAVDMETSALFSAAGFRGVDLGALLVVSDELSSLHWRPGFKTEAFTTGRSRACEVIEHLCRQLPMRTSSKGSPT
ncbi:MAG: nucleoside phosphorylase [Desulfobacterales bacterium]